MKKPLQLPELQYLLFISAFLFTIGVAAQDSANIEMSFVKSYTDTTLQWGSCPEFMPEGCNINVLHGNPALKNADILLKIPLNTSIANHRHTSAERMILLSGEMEVSYEGENPQKMVAGSYAFGPANKPHTVKCLQGPCFLFIAFEEPVDAVAVAAKK